MHQLHCSGRRFVVTVVRSSLCSRALIQSHPSAFAASFATGWSTNAELCGCDASLGPLLHIDMKIAIFAMIVIRFGSFWRFWLYKSMVPAHANDKMRPIISWNVTHLATSPRLHYENAQQKQTAIWHQLSLSYCTKDLSRAMRKNIIRYHDIHPTGSMLPCICCNFGGWLKEGVRSRRSIPFGLEIWDAAEALAANFSTFCRCRGSLVPDLGMVAVMRFSKLDIPSFGCRMNRTKSNPKPHEKSISLNIYLIEGQGAKWLPLQLL